MVRYLIAGLVAMTAVTSAQAVTLTYTADGGLPGYTTAQVFEAFTNGSANGTQFVGPVTKAVPGTPASATESSTGDVRFYQNDVAGEAVGPNPATGTFLAIENGTFTVDFGSAGVQFFSFAFGGLDTYNSVTLNFATGGPLTYNGGEIAGTSAGTTGQFGRASFDTNGTNSILSAVFGSTQAAFEIDELAAAVPEPATWGLMILGFGLVGWQLRARRRRDGKLATA